MVPSPDALSIVAGILIALVMKGVKHFWPAFNDTPALLKQGSAALLVVLTIGFAHQWQLGTPEFTEMFWGAVAAFGTHSLVLGSTDPPKTVPVK
jgi:hypothetical protein